MLFFDMSAPGVLLYDQVWVYFSMLLSLRFFGGFLVPFLSVPFEVPVSFLCPSDLIVRHVQLTLSTLRTGVYPFWFLNGCLVPVRFCESFIGQIVPEQVHPFTIGMPTSSLVYRWFTVSSYAVLL